jgi:protein-disulfide isomerase
VFPSLIVLTFGLLLLSRADERPAQPNRVVATVNGEDITSPQLDAAVRVQLEDLDQRARQLRQAALKKLIDNLLLEQAARAEGTTTDDYLRRNVESVGVSASEVDQGYERSRNQFAGVLPAEAKYRIRRTLEDNRRAAALNAVLEKLRQQAQVRNHLMADRLAELQFAAQEGPSMGDPGAPVTIVEFSDFECPYCRTAQPVLKRIFTRWPGRVHLVFRNFPLDRHARALAAARAAVCADQQNRFWAVHDRLFATVSLTGAALRAAAAESGLNTAEFEACINGELSLERVRQDILLGRTIGVSGTPAFFVNQQPVATAAELESAIERILLAERDVTVQSDH